MILKNVENNLIDARGFGNWIKKINKLNKNDQTNINVNVYNKIDEGTNYGIRYIKFEGSHLDITLFESILQKISLGNNLIYYRMFNFGDIFFELLFFHDLIEEEIPKDELVNEEWNITINKLYEYNSPVDNIGNRYYYIKKNFITTLIKQQTSLEQRAKDELNGFFYEGTVIDPNKIMKEYNEHYEDYEKLNDLIHKFSNILEKIRFDVHTLGK